MAFKRNIFFYFLPDKSVLMVLFVIPTPVVQRIVSVRQYPYTQRGARIWVLQIYNPSANKPLTLYCIYIFLFQLKKNF